MRVLRSEYMNQCISAARRGIIYDPVEIQTAIASILRDDDVSNAGDGAPDSAYESGSFTDSTLQTRQQANFLKYTSRGRALNPTDVLPLAFTGSKIEVYIHGINENTPKFDVEIQFSDVVPTANYVKIYQSYEDQLWHRIPRFGSTRSNWYFVCNLCKRRLSTFGNLRNHLNIHLDLYPFECDICNKRYHGLKSGRVHQLKHHS